MWYAGSIEHRCGAIPRRCLTVLIFKNKPTFLGGRYGKEEDCEEDGDSGCDDDRYEGCGAGYDTFAAADDENGCSDGDDDNDYDEDCKNFDADTADADSASCTADEAGTTIQTHPDG